jgi:hypothetical protein
MTCSISLQTYKNYGGHKIFILRVQTELFNSEFQTSMAPASLPPHSDPFSFVQDRSHHHTGAHGVAIELTRHQTIALVYPRHRAGECIHRAESLPRPPPASSHRSLLLSHAG